MRCKVFLRSCKLSSFAHDDAGLVEEAAQWAAHLVHEESRGPGDYENARRTVARKIGVPFAALWALRYRPPKNISPAKYLRIGGAYHDLCRCRGTEPEAKTWLGQALLCAVRAATSLSIEMDSQAEAHEREAAAIEREANALCREENGALTDERDRSTDAPKSS